MEVTSSSLIPLDPNSMPRYMPPEMIPYKNAIHVQYCPGLNEIATMPATIDLNTIRLSKWY